MNAARAQAEHLVAALRAARIDLVATLPDAWLGAAITVIDEAADMTLVRVTREDEAVAICAGAYLGGRRGAVLAQNAGLLLSTNVLAGYALHHQIPMLLVIVQRGRHDDDQYYQSYKGQVTLPVIEAIGLPCRVIDRPEDCGEIAQVAMQGYLARRPSVALLSRRAVLGAPGEAS